MDADALGVNLVIVSNWARTGWNVLKPNVLIDATSHTRRHLPWQQLRGRAALIYRNDPRTDLPTDLEHTLTELLAGRDRAIITGWLHAAAT